MGLQTLLSRVNDPQNTFVLTVGMMNGGAQSNIIADEVELVGTTRAFDKAFLNGEGKEEAASPPKKEANPPPCCARQPLPREGARVDTPSFLWKEVPRRGGGWMGKAV